MVQMVDMNHRHPTMTSTSDDQNFTVPVPAQDRSLESIMSDTRKHIRAIAMIHERLVRSRDELLSKREHIRILVKEVQVKRVEAGDAEVAFMTYVRTIATNGMQDLSNQEHNITLSDLYNRVESARNIVGVLETDLIQYGRALTGAEIRFQEEESAFYQYDLLELFEEAVSTIRPLTSTTSAQPTTSLRYPPPPPPVPPPPCIPPPPRPFPSAKHSLQQSLTGPLPWANSAPFHLNRRDLYPIPPPPPSPPYSLRQIDHVQQPTQFVKLSTSRHLSLSSLEKRPERLTEGKEHQRTSIEIDGMGKQFGAFDRVEIPPLDIGDDSDQPSVLPSTLRPDNLQSFTTPTRSLLRTSSSVAQSDMETDRAHVEDASVESVAAMGPRQFSVPLKHEDDTSLSAPQLWDRSLSESAIVEFPTKLAPKHRIRAWLFTLLDQNKIEQTLYKNILEDTLEEYGFTYPDNESWEEPAETFWSQDSRSNYEAIVSESDSEQSDPDISSQSSGIAQIAAGVPQRRRSTRIFPETKTPDRRVFDGSIGPFSDCEMDDPSYFPLPQSPDAIDHSDDDVMDEPCSFPLPPSPTSTETGAEGQEAPVQIKDP